MEIVQRNTDYAIRALVSLGRQPEGKVVSVSSLARELHVPQDFLRKIAQRLTSAGIVKSTRGRFGGISLAKPKDKVSVLDVMNALDAAPTVNRCFQTVCGNEAVCVVRPHLEMVKDAIEVIFQRITLAAILDGTACVAPQALEAS